MGFFGTAAVLAKAVECDVLHSGTSRVRSRCQTRALTFLRSEGTIFALQTARPSHSPDNHLEIAVLAVSSGKRKSSVLTQYFCPKYIHTFPSSPFRTPARQVKETSD